MKKHCCALFCLAAVSVFLASCATHNGSMRMAGLGDQPASMTGEPNNDSTAIGGSFESKMDDIDKTKLSRALDSGLGKSTTWTSGATGIKYTVVPTRKVKVGSNQFCRAYTITGERASNTNTYDGTACLGDDSNWHPV